MVNNMRRFVSVVVFVVCVINLQVVRALEAGDACQHTKTGKSGTCITILQCPTALDELKQHRMPQTCGFSGTVPIVCCPSATTATPTPTPTISMNINSVGAKSLTKCKEYSKHVYSTYIPPVLTGGKVQNKTRDDCGFKVVTLIVGGEKAKHKEFPHMTAIGYDAPDGGRTWLCGGSLVSENYVVTAAHCQGTRDSGPAKYVRVGDLNLKRTDDIAEPQEYDIAEFKLHPDYKYPAQYNDIALVRIKQNVRFSPFVRPICLTTLHQPRTNAAIATGWGKTGTFEDGSDDMLKVKLEWYTQAECKEAFSEISKRRLKDGIVEASQICAGSKEDVLKDTCPGDSGGPLQVYNLDEYCMYTLIGITSFGKLCGHGVAGSNPAVYTRVAHYVDWIEKTVWP